MKLLNALEKAFENLSIFKNLYEIIRLVDPVNKKTLYLNNGQIEKSESNCFDFWKTDSYCKNCISMRAYNENKTFVKIQYNKERLFMIIASPFNIESDRYVLELLKDVTECYIIENFENKSTEEIQKQIDDMNDKLIKDELTGIYNRRFINEKLPADIMKNNSIKSPLSIIMADVDFFKLVNDNFGHLAGDAILVGIASIISKSIRSNVDWVARYGGEEFLIVLDKTDNNSAYAITEKIRKEVEEATFEYGNNKIKVTVSFGICTLPLGDTTFDMNKMIKCADQNLYNAKAKGRNKSIR